MHVTFIATEVGFEADEHAIVCGVAGDGHYLTFQRAQEGSPGDEGVYLEYDDPANGGYGCISGCRIAKDWLAVDLSQQLGQLAGVTGFRIDLDLDAESVALLSEGLNQVFWG